MAETGHALGVIGLGTMGANLARNAARNGALVVLYNRTVEKVDDFLQAYGSEGHIVGKKSIEDLVRDLPTPRAILLMVPAGDPVDAVINELENVLQKDDILIDGGNSHYKDTERRLEMLKEKGIRYMGMGVSGGEKGALMGPSMMPGGDESAYRILEPLFQKMAADDGMGGKCVTYVGPGGAGHFVKMVHNGIEYALMQIIAECYDYLKTIGTFTNAQLAETFEAWSQSEELQGFLMEITGKIFRKKDEDVKTDLVDLIVDRAEGKGTGKWTVETAFDYGVPVPTISAALNARITSGVSLREHYAGKLPESLDTSEAVAPPLKERSIVRSACKLSMLVAYLEGFFLMEVVGKEKGWNLRLGSLARIWRGGCIIRSNFLPHIQGAYGEDQRQAKAEKEWFLDYFARDWQYEWRHVVDLGTSRGVPLPSMYAALAYYDSIRRERLPQNLIQAQRDFFGAHTYERMDKKGVFHTEWE